MLKLSIIIVNYNTKELLEELLKSICGSKCPIDFEIIVVDNNSQDGSAETVRKNYPQVRMTCNDKNVGFAKANNIGIMQSKGEYVLFLNTDTKIVGEALEKLVWFLDSNPEVAVVTGRVTYPDLTDQGVARTFPTPMNAIFGRHSLLTKLFPNNRYSRRYLVSLRHQSDEPFEVDWVSGACMMVRRDVLDNVGLFDEKYFMYWEDADLCYRIKEKGGKIYCVADAVIIHYEGKSGERKKARLIVEFNKSVYHYYRKHHVKRFFGLKNLAAVFGLTVRTLVLLTANILKVGNSRNKKGVTSNERT